MLTILLILLGVYLVGAMLSVSAMAKIENDTSYYTPAFLFSWAWLGLMLLHQDFEGFAVPSRISGKALLGMLIGLICYIGGMILIIGGIISLVVYLVK